MNPTALRGLGRTGIELTQLGFGGASIGSLFNRVPEGRAIATVRAAWDAGIRYFDTSPWYGRGLSELRTGSALRDESPSGYVLSSKVGRWLAPPASEGEFSTAPWVGGLPFEAVFDYSYDGIMRSFDQSRLRLGLRHVDLLVVHDLDLRHHGSEAVWRGYFDQLVTSGWRALDELRAAGAVRAIGAGINERGLISRYVAEFDPDFFLIAMPYTLLHQELLEDEFPRCDERGIGLIIGSVFQSGILATGAIDGAIYNYGPAPSEIFDRVRRIEAVCRSYDVPLAAAALQFPLGHANVASVIPGASRPDQISSNVEALEIDIPAALWADLRTEHLLRDDAPVPSDAMAQI